MKAQKLIECRYCHGRIQTEGPFCPHCGASLWNQGYKKNGRPRARRILGRGAVRTLFVLVFVAFVLGAYLAVTRIVLPAIRPKVTQGASITALSSLAAKGRSVRLLEGPDRYETAIQVSREGFPGGAPAVVLVSGNDYPDALCAGPLAGAYNGPLLYVPSDGLITDLKAELTRLHPAQVFMVGFASGTPLEDQVKAVLAQATVTLLSGQDRYTTAALVAQQVKAKLGTIAKVVVAPGDSFTPALAVGALAAAQGWPILLVPTRGDVPQATTQAMASLGATSALEVGTSIRLPIADVEHEQGADAYQTAALLAQYGLKHGLSFVHTVLATGESFPDALCVGPYLAHDKGMLLLTSNGQVPLATAGLLNAQSTHIRTLDVIGLPALAKELSG